MQAFDLDKVKKWSLFKSFGGTDGSNFTKAFSVVVQNNRGRFSLPYWRLARTNTASPRDLNLARPTRCSVGHGILPPPRRHAWSLYRERHGT
jgi:hypothetical protein